MKYERIYETIMKYVTPCLWLLTLKEFLRTRLLSFTHYRFTNHRFAYITRTIRFPRLNGLVRWLTLFTIWTFWLRTLQELIDLLTFNGLMCKDLQITSLLTLREQSDFPTLNDLVWWLTLFTKWILRLCILQELINLRTFNSLACWLTVLTLLIFFFTYNIRTNRFFEVNGSTNLLTLRTLQTFCLLTLLEHTALTGLHWYKRFSVSQTLDEATVPLLVTWLLQFPDLETSWSTLANGVKSSFLKG